MGTAGECRPDRLIKAVRAERYPGRFRGARFQRHPFPRAQGVEMAAVVMAVLAVAGLFGFAVTLLVVYLVMVRRLRRDPAPGAKVRLSGSDLVSLGLLAAIVWAGVSAGVLLTVYAKVSPYVVVGITVFALVLLRPLIQAKGRSVFVIDPAPRWMPKPVPASAGGRGEDAGVPVTDGAGSAELRSAVKPAGDDPVLGARANGFALVLGGIVFILGLGLAVYAISVLPLETRLAYDRLGRDGIPLPVAVALMPLAAFLTLRPVLMRKPEVHRMGKRSRMIIYWIVGPMFLGMLWAQWVIVESMLVDAGLMSG